MPAVFAIARDWRPCLSYNIEDLVLVFVFHIIHGLGGRSFLEQDKFAERHEITAVFCVFFCKKNHYMDHMFPKGAYLSS